MVNLAVWRFGGFQKIHQIQYPANISGHYIIVRIRCSRYGLAEVVSTHLQRKGPVLKCGTLSKKETEQVNEHVRQTLDEEAKVGMKRSVTIPLKTG